jgi:tetratricopeptide (TPR) repeat protein
MQACSCGIGDPEATAHRVCGVDTSVSPTIRPESHALSLNSMKRQGSKVIGKALQTEDWAGARRLIQAELRLVPKDHWLMSRLALTYYEQQNYKKALYWDALALREAPYCPLAVWGYAGSLDMLCRSRESLILYRWVLSWGEEDLAYGECGEGIRWARSLATDCHYRIARIWEEKRQWKKALSEYDEYLTRRADGCGSIYSLGEVRTSREHVRSQTLR